MNSNRENDHFDRFTSDMTLSHHFEKMSQHDAVRFLDDEGLPANVLRAPCGILSATICTRVVLKIDTLPGLSLVQGIVDSCRDMRRKNQRL
jgi:hypothetical protein